jgi:hypothetical protein
LERAVYLIGSGGGSASDDYGFRADLAGFICRLKELRAENHRGVCWAFAALRNFHRTLQINSWLAFAGCAAIVVGAYAAAHGSILVKAYGGKIHPATMVFGQMLCGILPIIIYALTVEGNPLALNWTWRAMFASYINDFRHNSGVWLYYWL